MRTTFIAGLAALATLAFAATAPAQTSTSGRTFAFASSGPGLIPLGSGVVAWASATIPKAKRKHVIVIDGSVSYTGNAALQFVDVGTRVLTPISGETSADGGYYQTDCSGAVYAGSCTVSGHWWVDIDALEAIEPGKWANQPVQVDLQGGAMLPSGTGLGSYNLRVLMLKK